MINPNAWTDFIDMVNAVYRHPLAPVYLLLGVPAVVDIYQGRYRATLQAALTALMGHVGPAGMLMVGALLHPLGKSRSYLDFILLVIGLLGFVMIIRAARRITPKWAMIPFFGGVTALNVAALVISVVELDGIFI